jgi:hypothetical protein
LLAILATVLGTLAAPAVQAADWVIQSASGTALVLDGEKWVDVSRDELLSGDFTVRTLPGASLSIGTEGAALAVKSEAVLVVAERGAAIEAELVAGAVAALVEGPRRMHLVAGTVGIELAGASAEVSHTGPGVHVRARSGSIVVAGGDAGTHRLTPGSTETFASAEPDPAAQAEAATEGSSRPVSGPAGISKNASQGGQAGEGGQGTGEEAGSADNARNNSAAGGNEGNGPE